MLRTYVKSRDVHALVVYIGTIFTPSFFFSPPLSFFTVTSVKTVVKFSSRVHFVAPFLASSSLVLCCLEDGRISALHVMQALAR